MTKRQFRVLYRQFLFRMVDLEVLSAHAEGDARKLLGRFASLLVFVSVMIGLGAMGFLDPNMTPAARLDLTLYMEHFLVATTMLVVGIFAVLSWDSTSPTSATSRCSPLCRCTGGRCSLPRSRPARRR